MSVCVGAYGNYRKVVTSLSKNILLFGQYMQLSVNLVCICASLEEFEDCLFCYFVHHIAELSVRIETILLFCLI